MVPGQMIQLSQFHFQARVDDPRARHDVNVFGVGLPLVSKSWRFDGADCDPQSQIVDNERCKCHRIHFFRNDDQLELRVNHRLEHGQDLMHSRYVFYLRILELYVLCSRVSVTVRFNPCRPSFNRDVVPVVVNGSDKLSTEVHMRVLEIVLGECHPVISDLRPRGSPRRVPLGSTPRHRTAVPCRLPSIKWQSRASRGVRGSEASAAA